MIFLVGVDHLVQYRGPLPETIRSEFRDFIVESCRARAVRMIAEEFSIEALRDVYHSTADTAMEAAIALGIEHRFCDPEESELRRLGIPYFAEIRDGVMARRGLGPGFILDDETRSSVRHETEIIAKSFWPTRELYWYDRISDVPEAHILFICGHEHVASFQRLLVEHGHRCNVITPWWKEDLFKDYTNFGL